MFPNFSPWILDRPKGFKALRALLERRKMCVWFQSDLGTLLKQECGQIPCRMMRKSSLCLRLASLLCSLLSVEWSQKWKLLLNSSKWAKELSAAGYMRCTHPCIYMYLFAWVVVFLVLLHYYQQQQEEAWKMVQKHFSHYAEGKQMSANVSWTFAALTNLVFPQILAYWSFQRSA